MSGDGPSQFIDQTILLVACLLMRSQLDRSGYPDTVRRQLKTRLDRLIADLESKGRGV